MTIRLVDQAGNSRLCDVGPYKAIRLPYQAVDDEDYGRFGVYVFEPAGLNDEYGFPVWTQGGVMPQLPLKELALPHRDIEKLDAAFHGDDA